MKRGQLSVIVLLLACLASAACAGQASPTPTARAPAGSPTRAATATLPPLLPTPIYTQVLSLTPLPTATRGPATPMPSPALTPGGPTYHVVQRGETLFGIGQRYGVSVVALAAANNIADPAYVVVGSRLLIPGPDFVVPTPTPGPPPTATPVRATATPTMPPATATPAPTATPAFAYYVESITRIPNCGVTHVWGYVRDAAGNALPGHLVKVGAVGYSWFAVSNPTAGDGYYDVSLSDGMKAGRWYVFMVDAAGNQISNRVEVVTDADESQCYPEGGGNQTPRVDFKRRS